MLDLARLAPIAVAIIPLVDVVKRVVQEWLHVEMDYGTTLLTVLIVSIVLGLTHFYYPTWPMALQVVGGSIIIGLDAAGVVKVAQTISAPKA